MKLRSPIHTHPFKLLLYLEWALLALTFLIEASPPGPSLPFMPNGTITNLLSILAFGLMGLWIPTRRRTHKLVYTGIEVALLLFMTIPSRVMLMPLVCVVMVIRGCVMFSMPGRIITVASAFGLFLFGQIQHFNRFKSFAPPGLESCLVFRPRDVGSLSAGLDSLRQFQIGLSIIFGLCLIFVLLLVNAVLSERQSREELAIANDRLRRYALRIEDQAKLEERNRIAREIHDSLGHSLTALNIQMETVLKLWQANPEKAATFLAEAKRLGSTALQDVRQSVATMRSDPLEGKSLDEAIASLCQEFQLSTAIVPHVQIDVPLDSLPSDVNVAVFRIVQEALTNICKYAVDGTEPLKVQIGLQIQNASLHLQIQDNGKGFELKQNKTGFGLQGMRERTLALDGQFHISSAIDAGCKIDAYFPLPKLKLTGPPTPLPLVPAWNREEDSQNGRCF
ncbi:sensor histidine kinase [Tumidithrix elongata RA019]|uniref:histidine kinase n=1 Tax=Tumidithrix elongata BACA0141 TaxID=2716417 RepID=A0AAW9PWI6_9CYAN|nr:sensor histidine kinase [Tumidithrix elongata RA019]